MQKDRLNMISSLIQRELALILHQEVEPTTGITSVVEVALSKDAGFADVYILFFDQNTKNHQNYLKLLQQRANHIRSLLAKKISLRYMPKLRFHLDESVLYARNIENLLGNIQ